jgi:nitrate reductase NapD
MKTLNTNQQSPSRRDLLKGGFSRPTPHIASLMVQARPEHIPALTPQLNAISGVEVHASADNGRMVVTVEADSDQHLLDLITAIETRQHVINTALVYHQIEV